MVIVFLASPKYPPGDRPQGVDRRSKARAFAADKGKKIIALSSRPRQDVCRAFPNIGRATHRWRDGAFVRRQEVGPPRLAQPMPQPQTEQQDFIVIQAAQPIGGRLGEHLTPALIASLGHGEGDVIVRKRLDAGMAAELGNVPILKNANEPRDQRAIAVIAGQDGKLPAASGRKGDPKTPSPPNLGVPRCEDIEPSLRRSASTASNRCGPRERRTTFPTPWASLQATAARNQSSG